MDEAAMPSRTLSARLRCSPALPAKPMSRLTACGVTRLYPRWQPCVIAELIEPSSAPFSPHWRRFDPRWGRAHRRRAMEYLITDDTFVYMEVFTRAVTPPRS